MKIIDFELEDLQQQYDGHDPDISELKLLVKAIIEEKTFRFTYVAAARRFPLSVANGRLMQDGRIVAGTDTTLSEDPINFYTLMRRLDQIEPYGFARPLVDLIAFIDKFGKLFDRGGTIIGGWMLERLLWFLFVATFRAGHYDPMSQMNTIPVTRPASSSLYRLYFTNTGIWNYSFQKFWTTTAEFVKATGGEKPGVIDLNWREAMKTVLAELEKQKDFVNTKMTVLASMGDNPVGRMAEIALCWLDSQSAFSDEEILSWLDDPQTVTTSIVVITSRKVVVAELAEKFWRKVQVLTLAEIQRSLLYQFSVKVLESSTGLLLQTADELKAYLLREAEKGEGNQIWSLLYALQSYPTGTDFVTSVIDQIIELTPNQEIYNQAIGNYFIAANDLDRFFAFVHRFAMWPERYFKVRHFRHSCKHFYQANPAAYLHQVVKLLLDDWGMVRKVGGRLLSHYLDEQDLTGFQIDPEGMDALQQYKFIVSATGYPALLESTLRILVPFLGVKSEIVFELVMCRLETAAESYQSKLLEKIVPLLRGHPKETIVFNRLSEVASAACEISNKKHAIAEFNAYVAYPGLIRQFYKSYGKRNQKTMQEARKNHNGISSMLTHIDISKGGGSMMPDGSIVPLSTVRASFEIPALAYLDPVDKALDSYNFITSNWANDFEPWNEIIYSSGNI